jgi:hypothetical protein
MEVCPFLILVEKSPALEARNEIDRDPIAYFIAHLTHMTAIIAVTIAPDAMNIASLCQKSKPPVKKRAHTHTPILM